MSATTYQTAPARPVHAITISRILKAEWTKLRTLPSTWRTAAFALVFSIAAGAVLVISQADQWAIMTAAQHRTFDATSCSLFGVMIAAVLLGALAVRSVSAEYATGMIRSTFASMPSRRLVLAGKAVTVAAFAFPVALVSNFVGFEIGQRIFAAKHLQVGLGHPGVLVAILFGAVAVSLIAVIGVGLAGVIRHTAGRPRPWPSSSSEGSRSASFFQPTCAATYPVPPSRMLSPFTARPGSWHLARPSWSSGRTPPSPWARQPCEQRTATPDPSGPNSSGLTTLGLEDHNKVAHPVNSSDGQLLCRKYC